QAMREKLTIPLMVTGGFRHRAAMREALATGAVDLIGIARPFCVMPDAAARLLAGLDALPCPEEHLRPLPRPLAFLTRLPAVRALTGFATIYWFYEQLWQLGHKGRPEPGLSPLVASLRVERRHKAIMKARAGARASG
ncbi:MAG: NADH:flavin oxidoreductase, partial [Alphaproteobacteria bacterium]